MRLRRRRLARSLRTADAARRRRGAPRRGLRSALARRRHMFKPPRAARPARPRVPRLPHMRPRRSVVDRVLPTGDPSPPRTVIRLRVMGALVAALFSLMFIRLWYLQVLDTSSFSRTVTANQVRPVEVPAPRGLILDRTGATMVGDQVTQDLTLSRVAAQQHPEVVGSLATLLGIPPGQIQADLANPQYSLYKPVPIMENAPLPDVLYIGEHATQFPGVSAVADTTRTYPMGDTGAQMLGYVGQIQKLQPGYQLGDLVGLSGIEQQYEPVLRGTPGIDRVEVDAQGEVVGDLGQTAPKSGGDLATNVDAGLEVTLQQALDQEIGTLHGASHGGAAVALDPQTGAVLALVSSPSYDPTWWTPNGISVAHYQQLLHSGSLNDNAIQGLYTPGSTFKLATATAALGTGLISPGYYYDDTGSYTIPGCATGGSGCNTYHDNDGEVGGEVNVTSALTISSDIFFYNLGVQFWDQQSRFGKTPIQDAANALGYGVVTGIDLPNETHFARVDSPSVVQREHQQDPKDYPNGDWFTGNNLELAFGQGGTVITPIEQAVAYATFANGGTRYAPEIGAGVVDPISHKVLQRIAPKVLGHVSYSAAAYRAMLAGFEGVVSNPHGTAYGAFTGFPLGTFPLAGKTGTATTQEQQPNSWFVGWGPLPNPQYLIAVVIEGGGFGSEAAAPVVRQGFDYLVAHPESATRLAAPPTMGPGVCVPATPTTTVPGSSSSTTSSTTTTTPGATTTTTSPCPSSSPPPAPTSSALPSRSPPSRGTARAAPAPRSRPPPGPL